MSIKLTILGCGGSAGVPAIGNRWGKCDPNEPKNRRTRCSAMVRSEETTIIIDTGPDFRDQMNSFFIPHTDAILYTHWHSDHVNGFEELRPFYLYNKSRGRLSLYADEITQELLKSKFPHVFITDDKTGFYPLPVEFKGWDETAYGNMQTVGDIPVKPFPMLHYETLAVGYRFGDVAYCTDLSDLPEVSYDSLEGVKTMVIDCNNLFDEDCLIHANLEKVYAINARVKCPDVILTHLKNNCDYDTVSAQLPDGYRLAYDGLEIIIEP